MDGWVRALLAAAVSGTLAGCASKGTATALPATCHPAALSHDHSSHNGRWLRRTLALLPTAGPSPTPQAYTVRANDTFLGIARAYGLTREELLAANPGLNPDFLSIGQQLLIPAPGGQGTATPIPTPTPLPLQTSDPRCYPSASGGLWCLVSVTNTTGSPVEGLSGLLTLVGSDGEPMITVPVYPPLNLLPADEVMVLAAYLTPPVPEFSRAVAALTMGVPVQQAESRYASLDWSITRTQPSADRLSWEVAVSVKVPADSATAVAAGDRPAGPGRSGAGDRIRKMGAGRRYAPGRAGAEQPDRLQPRPDN